jgi:hypothetical protein
MKNRCAALQPCSAVRLRLTGHADLLFLRLRRHHLEEFNLTNVDQLVFEISEGGAAASLDKPFRTATAAEPQRGGRPSFTIDSAWG